MLDDTQQRAVTELTDALLSVRPLVAALDGAVRVTGPGGRAGELAQRLAARLGVPTLALSDPAGDLEPFGRVVSRRLRLADLSRPLAALPDAAAREVDAVADRAAAADFEAFCRTSVVTTADGATFTAYAAGSPEAPAVVLAPPCGMPARLAERWVRSLAEDHFVVLGETRGLFGDVDDFDAGIDVEAQVGDLFAVMDRFGVRSAHVAGFCGGAVIALRAAVREPGRVTSLSLWHGDFELGDAAPKTDHQRNLQALMATATRTRASAAGVHAVLCQSMLHSAPPDLAHLVLYPYATPDLLFRYCALNGAVMATDVREWVASVTQPVLVVTSADDATAHPDGSRLVADRLPRSRLLVTEHGDHMSLFRGAPDRIAAARTFLSDVGQGRIPGAAAGADDDGFG